MGVGEDLLQSSEKRDEGVTATDDECRILEFLGFFANPNQSPQTLKLHVELKGIPMALLTVSSLVNWFRNWAFQSIILMACISDWETTTEFGSMSVARRLISN